MITTISKVINTLQDLLDLTDAMEYDGRHCAYEQKEYKKAKELLGNLRKVEELCTKIK